MPLDRETQIATCIGCGCDDEHACVDVFHDACHWLKVDYEKGIGVCSQCRRYLKKWDKEMEKMEK